MTNDTVSSEIQVHFYKTTWHHIPENSNFHNNCGENHKFQEKCMWIQIFKTLRLKKKIELAIFSIKLQNEK